MRQKKDMYVVRFPEGMRDHIKVEAAKNKRSMNAEIIYQLEIAYGTKEKGEATA